MNSESGAIGNAPVLELKSLCKSFDGLQAVRDVTLTVMPGDRKAIIGPNGAGKTTLFNVITGIYPATSGQIVLFGSDVTSWPSHRRTALGIAPAPQAYLNDMKRRMSALVLLWWATVEEPYIEPHLEKFAARTREWLYQHCKEAGFPVPTEADLIRMGENGAFPGEKRSSVNRRLYLFLRNAAISGSYAPTPLMRLRWWFDEKLGR